MNSDASLQDVPARQALGLNVLNEKAEPTGLADSATASSTTATLAPPEDMDPFTAVARLKSVPNLKSVADGLISPPAEQSTAPSFQAPDWPPDPFTFSESFAAPSGASASPPPTRGGLRRPAPVGPRPKSEGATASDLWNIASGGTPFDVQPVPAANTTSLSTVDPKNPPPKPRRAPPPPPPSRRKPSQQVDMSTIVTTADIEGSPERPNSDPGFALLQDDDDLAWRSLMFKQASVCLYLAMHVATSGDVKLAPPKHPKVIELRNYTPKELLEFDGKDGKRILMGVNGKVFGGMYGNFAGHDASRGLAKDSFDIDMITPEGQPIDKLEDLAADEWEALRGWASFFAGKYPHVGYLVEEDA
ncbi:hypothetical protein HK101_001534 [Irineochytrium annulatum]|nr:hypothetical protein HK101_001534 [Irineochytrium annulatum]